MSVLDIRNVSKHYRSVKAVDDVTFAMPKGSIFGLLGPNGAGKTSLIRMITQITGLDAGEIFIDSESLQPKHTADIGYMPEERGLYKKMKVGEQLVYLAQLKDIPSKKAKPLVQEWLAHFDISDWWNRKVEDLSKGMQQKVQFISTIMHEPKLLILDEPFSGLDPINTNLIRDEIDRLVRDRDISVIFSTHRMEQVEEICDNIALISNGKCVLNGPVADLKQSFKKNLHAYSYTGHIADAALSSYNVVEKRNGYLVVQLKDAQDSNNLFTYLVGQGAHITSYTELLPSMNEI